MSKDNTSDGEKTPKELDTRSELRDKTSKLKKSTVKSILEF